MADIMHLIAESYTSDGNGWPGDQSAKECRTINWYNCETHSGWGHAYRWINRELADRFAAAMLDITTTGYCGYPQVSAGGKRNDTTSLSRALFAANYSDETGVNKKLDYDAWAEDDFSFARNDRTSHTSAADYWFNPGAASTNPLKWSIHRLKNECATACGGVVFNAIQHVTGLWFATKYAPAIGKSAPIVSPLINPYDFVSGAVGARDWLNALCYPSFSPATNPAWQFSTVRIRCARHSTADVPVTDYYDLSDPASASGKTLTLHDIVYIIDSRIGTEDDPNTVELPISTATVKSDSGVTLIDRKSYSVRQHLYRFAICASEKLMWRSDNHTEWQDSTPTQGNRMEDGFTQDYVRTPVMAHYIAKSDEVTLLKEKLDDEYQPSGWENPDGTDYWIGRKYVKAYDTAYVQVDGVDYNADSFDAKDTESRTSPVPDVMYADGKYRADATQSIKSNARVTYEFDTDTMRFVRYRVRWPAVTVAGVLYNIGSVTVTNEEGASEKFYFPYYSGRKGNVAYYVDSNYTNSYPITAETAASRNLLVESPFLPLKMAYVTDGGVTASDKGVFTIPSNRSDGWLRYDIIHPGAYFEVWTNDGNNTLKVKEDWTDEFGIEHHTAWYGLLPDGSKSADRVPSPFNEDGGEDDAESQPGMRSNAYIIDRPTNLERGDVLVTRSYGEGRTANGGHVAAWI